MSFHVLPSGRRPVAEHDPCDVIDLASRRGAAPCVPEIPAHVLDEIDVAAARCDALRAENREIRFEAHPGTGRLTASLRDLGGGVVRTLPLREVVSGDGGPQTAA